MQALFKPLVGLFLLKVFLKHLFRLLFIFQKDIVPMLSLVVIIGGSFGSFIIVDGYRIFVRWLEMGWATGKIWGRK